MLAHFRPKASVRSPVRVYGVTQNYVLLSFGKDSDLVITAAFNVGHDLSISCSSLGLPPEGMESVLGYENVMEDWN